MALRKSTGTLAIDSTAKIALSAKRIWVLMALSPKDNVCEELAVPVRVGD
jgi:hypothetical protein